ncbi:hypothetical protein BT69DRAFT_1275351 [Atractiella rhizophila]|nr:hypothetical protein BT69DRAFT_1279120 [Atractiella rhizophila]KAH8930624.1 hypothetical protein BT69DRAFT_1275351 [Atractiella rhizophila]
MQPMKDSVRKERLEGPSRITDVDVGDIARFLRRERRWEGETDLTRRDGRASSFCYLGS